MIIIRDFCLTFIIFLYLCKYFTFQLVLFICPQFDIFYFLFIICIFMKHVDEENCYLCGYLKITGLTFEFPTLTTFFDAEIISKRYPFLTRKWDADEEVDRKHWVSIKYLNDFIY